MTVRSCSRCDYAHIDDESCAQTLVTMLDDIAIESAKSRLSAWMEPTEDWARDRP